MPSVTHPCKVTPYTFSSICQNVFLCLEAEEHHYSVVNDNAQKCDHRFLFDVEEVADIHCKRSTGLHDLDDVAIFHSGLFRDGHQLFRSLVHAVGGWEGVSDDNGCSEARHGKPKKSRHLDLVEQTHCCVVADDIYEEKSDENEGHDEGLEATVELNIESLEHSVVLRNVSTLLTAEI